MAFDRPDTAADNAALGDRYASSNADILRITQVNWHIERKSCCSRCFRHPWLCAYVEEHSSTKGNCMYCDAENTSLIPVSALSGYFENLIKMYKPSNSMRGDPLVYLMQDSWQIFNEELAETKDASQLVNDILISCWDDDSGEDPVDSNELYVYFESSVHFIERFETFIAECRQTEKAEPDFPEILDEDIRRFEEQVPAGSTFYRARTGFATEDAEGSKLPWSGAGIGANPSGRPSRANRQGKIVLYGAAEEKTAIAEVRPARGFLVSVAELRTNTDLWLLDLTRAQVPLNPFLEDGETIPYWLELDQLLSRIAWTLARPLERDDNPLDYLPSQRLSEYAERVRFHGVRYPSAMIAGGTNIVFFDPAVCDVAPARLVKVTHPR